MKLGIKIEFSIHIYRNDGKKDAGQQEITENKEIIDCQNNTDSFFKTARDAVEKLEKSRSISTISNYRCALNSLMSFLNRDISISEMNADLLESYEKWLRNKNVCMNSVSCYMRSLRSLITKVFGKESRLMFNNIYTGRPKTSKRAIPESDLSRIKALKLDRNSFLCLVRDVFLFSFYALGMPFVDICFLRKTQIFDGQLVYERHKTGQKVIVQLEPCMTEIIARYQREDSDYVFPLLKSSDPLVAYRQYLSKLSCYNKSLRRLAKKAGVPSRLTSYTPRHTWASVANSSNIDLPVISKALGHTNTQTTLTYIKEIDDKRLFEANKMIIDKIIQ